MKKISFLVFLILLLVRCEKSNIQLEEVKLSNRNSLDQSTRQWLEDFRLNLITFSSNNSYTPNEVEYGLESLYNLIGLNSLREMTNTIHYSYNVNVNISSGNITKTNISNFAENIFDNVNLHFNNLTLANKKLIFIDVKLLSQTSTIATYEVAAIVSDGSAPDFNGSYDDDLACAGNDFDEECWRSGWGDLDDIDDPEIYIGGDCDEELNGNTTAQEIIQENINDRIPREIKTKFGLTGTIKYIEQQCINFDFDDLYPFTDDFVNCNGIDLDFFDDYKHSYEINYDEQRLQFAKCMINQYISSVNPGGKTLSYINIFGSLAPTNGGNSSAVRWRGKVCFGKPVVIPIQIPTPDPGPLPGSDSGVFFSSNSILNL